HDVVLKLRGESGGLAEPANGAGDEREHLRVAKATERSGRTSHDGFRAVAAAVALIERSKVDIGLSGVLAGKAAAAPGDREEGVHVLLLVAVQEVVFDGLFRLLRSVERSAGRKAELHRCIPLV